MHPPRVVRRDRDRAAQGLPGRPRRLGPFVTRRPRSRPKRSDGSDSTRCRLTYCRFPVLTRERLQIGNSEHVAPDPGDFSTREATM
jgi:hypothetical protein